MDLQPPCNFSLWGSVAYKVGVTERILVPHLETNISNILAFNCLWFSYLLCSEHLESRL